MLLYRSSDCNETLVKEGISRDRGVGVANGVVDGPRVGVDGNAWTIL